MAFVTVPDWGIKSVDWMLDRPAQANVSSWTGRRTVVSNPWHGKWSGKVELAPIIGEAKFRPVRSFLARVKGTTNTFRIPATEGAQNQNNGVTLAATAGAGATSLTVSGMAGGRVAPLLDGQFFTIHGQLCCCTSDMTDVGLVTFEPPLRQITTAGTAIVTSRPYALVSMANSRSGWRVAPGPVYMLSFDVEEAILEADGAVPE